VQIIKRRSRSLKSPTPSPFESPTDRQ
jgi:hypothetical protein